MASFNIFVLLVVGIIALANAEPEPEAYFGDNYKSGYGGSAYSGINSGYLNRGYSGINSGYVNRGYSGINSGYLNRGYSGINSGYLNRGYSGIGNSRGYSSGLYNNGVYERRNFGYAY